MKFNNVSIPRNHYGGSKYIALRDQGQRCVSAVTLPDDAYFGWFRDSHIYDLIYARQKRSWQYPPSWSWGFVGILGRNTA